jgi:hypothetical protein
MNLKVARRVSIAALLLVTVVLAIFAGHLRWQDTLEGKIVQDVSATLPDGTVQYGPYCTQDGAKLEGGGICHVTQRTVAYKPLDAVAHTLAVFLMVLGVMGGLGILAINAAFRKINDRRQLSARAMASAS